MEQDDDQARAPEGAGLRGRNQLHRAFAAGRAAHPRSSAAGHHVSARRPPIGRVDAEKAAQACCEQAGSGAGRPPCRPQIRQFQKKPWYNPMGWFNREEYASFPGEPVRQTLTDPPAGYRIPSPEQPYGISQTRNRVRRLPATARPYKPASKAREQNPQQTAPQTTPSGGAAAGAWRRHNRARRRFCRRSNRLAGIAAGAFLGGRDRRV